MLDSQGSGDYWGEAADLEDTRAQEDSFPWTTPHSGFPGDTEHSDTRVTPVAYKEPYFTQDKARFSGCGRSGTFHSFMACLKGLTALGRFKVLASLHMVVTPQLWSLGLGWLDFPHVFLTVGMKPSINGQSGMSQECSTPLSCVC